MKEDLLDPTSLSSAVAKARALESFLHSLSRDNRYQDFVKEVLVAIGEAVKSEAGSIIELNHESRNLFFRAAYGQSAEQVHSFIIPLGEGIVGHVAESKQPLIVNDVANSNQHLRAVQDAVAFQTRNLIAIPLVIRGRVYGVLELLNKIGDEGYSTEDLELLTTLCNAAAKAIETRLMLAWALKASMSKTRSEAA